MATGPITDAAKRFATDTEHHQLTVLHEDGLYRHIRAQQPGTGHCWFDLITWPGTLTVKGDMGTYTFSRAQDMLDFFRRSTSYDGPNLSYWEEKLDAVDSSSGVRTYSVDLLRQHIADDVTAEAEADLDRRIREQAEELDLAADRLPAGVADACRAASSAYMDGLREALDDELLGEYPTWCIEDEGDALAGIRQFSYRPDSAPYSEQSFTFDPTEWDVREYAWHYVWCCHAILWAIAAYDRARAEQSAPELQTAATLGLPAEQPVPVLASAAPVEG
jgi:hypothetical protein